MVTRKRSAAPPTPWSKDLAEPKIDPTAYIHSFSNLIGDVRVGSNVLIAPGTSIRADEGYPFYIGSDTNIQDGVVIHGLEEGRVTGEDGNQYSVWIGKETCITHMALIHGPAYVGDNCFIGFRSTVFNAKIGNGCVVMMHALIQDVEIPAGKYVPSGAVITHQQQADRLPDVNESDRSFAHHVVQINEALAAGYHCADDATKCVVSFTDQIGQNKNQESQTTTRVETMSLQVNIREQVRNLLAQGYTIGTEYANQRRFKTNSWLSGPTLEGKREDQIVSQLQALIQESPDQYIRLIGIDSQAKKRVAEVIIQRPGETPTISSSSTPNSNSGSPPSSNGYADSDITSQVRSLLQQGYQIGVEYASARRFKTSSWLTAGTISTRNENSAVQELKQHLQDHPEDYIRIVGVDPQAKKRVAEVIIQRPGATASSSSKASKQSSSHVSTPSYAASSSGLDGDTISQVRNLLNQGYRIGTEHADLRRFKTKSWHTCAPIESNREAEVIRALEACLNEHQGEYVRLIGIDPKQKRRVLESIIQRPDSPKSKVGGQSSTSTLEPKVNSSTEYHGNGNGKSTVTGGSLDPDTVSQIRNLLAQGYQIGTEHADLRRFKTKSWHSCDPIDSTREAEVIRALEACLTEHQGEYVRLIGIDSKQKRRVLETIIQRP